MTPQRRITYLGSAPELYQASKQSQLFEIMLISKNGLKDTVLTYHSRGYLQLAAKGLDISLRRW